MLTERDIIEFSGDMYMVINVLKYKRSNYAYLIKLDKEEKCTKFTKIVEFKDGMICNSSDKTIKEIEDLFSEKIFKKTNNVFKKKEGLDNEK